MFNIFTSVSLGQCCDSKTHTDKWVWCLEEGALCCITVGNWGTKVTFSSLFPVEGSNTKKHIGWVLIVHGWCHCQNFGVFDNAIAYAAPGLTGRALLDRCEGGLGQYQACCWQDVRWDAEVRGTEWWQRYSAAFSYVLSSAGPSGAHLQSHGLIW